MDLGNGIVTVGRTVIADREGRYVVYEVIRPWGPYGGKHVISMDVSISAVSYMHSFDLTREESAMIGTAEGQATFRALARMVQDNPWRYANRTIVAAPGYEL